MATAEKLRLKKELEKLHGAVKSFRRDDLVTGRWFGSFLQSSLAAMANPPSPQELREQLKGNETTEDLVDEVVSRIIHEAIAATDAYQENLSGTEIKNLKEKKPGGEQKLSGDVMWLVAELLYATKLCVDLVFKVGAAHDRMVTADKVELFGEVFGRSLGAFDYETAKKAGNALEQVGQKIFDRAIAQTVGGSLGDAQRKGFYAYYAKAIAKETARVAGSFPKWEPQKPRQPETGPMVAVAEDDPGPAY